MKKIIAITLASMFLTQPLFADQCLTKDQLKLGGFSSNKADLDVECIIKATDFLDNCQRVIDSIPVDYFANDMYEYNKSVVRDIVVSFGALSLLTFLINVSN